MAPWKSPSKRMVDEQSEFMREITLRGERHTREVVAKLNEQTTTLVGLQGEIAALQGEIADQRKQIQAETQAIFSVIDRLN